MIGPLFPIYRGRVRKLSTHRARKAFIRHINLTLEQTDLFVKYVILVKYGTSNCETFCSVMFLNNLCSGFDKLNVQCFNNEW
jgi:hypothetical protein